MEIRQIPLPPLRPNEWRLACETSERNSQIRLPPLAMAHLLSLLVLLFLLAVHVSHGSLFPPIYDDSMCSESFMCGGFDIRYPFYLSDATRPTPDYKSYYSCGYTDLKIFCQSDGIRKTPILHLGGYSYTILNISYDDHTIILRDSEVLRGNGCPRVSHNVALGQEWLNYTDSFESLTFFFDCSLEDQPRPDLEEYQIDCNGFISNPDVVSFVLISGPEERNVSQEYQLADHCLENFVVPVHEDDLLRRNPPVFPSQYGAVLKQGFELEWNKSTSPACHLCEQSYGRCAFSENRTFVGCLCSGGKVGVLDCYGTGDTTANADSTSRPRRPQIATPSSSINSLQRSLRPASHAPGRPTADCLAQLHRGLYSSI